MKSYLRLAVLFISVLSCRRDAPAAGTSDRGGFAGTISAASAPPTGSGTLKPSGAQLYASLCAPCHGVTAQGYAADHAPSLVNPTFLESATDEFLKSSITVGRPGTSMGAYGKPYGGPLDEAGLNAVVAFLRARGAAAKMLPMSGPGDAARGAPLYAKVCKTCHGDTQIRGEAVHLANAQFLNQASDAFIRHAVVAGRPGTKMLAFAQTLTPAQINDVVAFVRGFSTTAPVVELLPAPTGKEPLVLNPKAKDPDFVPKDDRFVGVDAINVALRAKRRLIVIDARPPSEWMRVHITGAVSIPYHDLKRLDEVPDGVWVVAYCACPHHLSGEVVDALRKRGHKQAYVLDEGINEWHRRGYPVVAARGVALPPPEPRPPVLPSPKDGGR